MHKVAPIFGHDYVYKMLKYVLSLNASKVKKKQNKKNSHVCFSLQNEIALF